MTSKNFSLRVVAAAALLGLSGVSQAALTVYTDEALFNAAVIYAGSDNFSSLAEGDLGTPYSGSTTVGTLYGYEASAPIGLYGLVGMPMWLSVLNAGDTLTVGNFSAGVKAVGGYFFTTNTPGNTSGGTVTVTGSDGGALLSSTIIGATPGSFVGFVSTGLMSSVTVTADNASNGVPDYFYPTVGKLVLASAVPEPETCALMLAGLGLVGLMARRRRA